MKTNLTASKTVLKEKAVDVESLMEKLEVDQENADQVEITVLYSLWDNILLLNN